MIAHYSSTRAANRKATRAAFAHAVSEGLSDDLRGRVEDAREAHPPLVPFHWEVEFPEVFERENGGFDAMVGNPPFAGKNTLGSANPTGYPDWLKQAHDGTHGNADLVAHFFRRAYTLLRRDGTLGLIATNTIGQGDTRATGLRWICTHGGQIYQARRRVKWPGMAAVVVSVVHVARGEWLGRRRLDDREVVTITAFLFHRGGHEDPAQLRANAGMSFQGSIVLGMGFTFDDTDAKGVATPIAEMRRLIEDRPENCKVIYPYIGGDEVNNSTAHAHHRYVINFGEREEDECRKRWPELMSIVERRVRPSRLEDNRENYRKYWWQFAEKRRELKRALVGLDRVLVQNCGATPHLAIALQPADRVFANSLAVFSLETLAAFCALQARPHEIWARFFGSSMKDDLRYTPSDCFETFPFPEGWQSHPVLETAGRAYYEHRAQLMVANNEGLTTTYNRFHDPDERDPEILKLRELHALMDRAVLDAYGWTGVPTHCEFILDYEEEDESGRRKKPWRYRWPDEVHDDVLALLIELNAERAAAEQRSGAAAVPKGKGGKAKRSVAPPQEEKFF
ncbi:MAG: type IIL restriction-modification enzyme MmeI [Thermoleophilia bacterium]